MWIERLQFYPPVHTVNGKGKIKSHSQSSDITGNILNTHANYQSKYTPCIGFTICTIGM